LELILDLGIIVFIGKNLKYPIVHQKLEILLKCGRTLRIELDVIIAISL
jgi:hypothetical protein